jgi:hypothetical protein
MATAGSFLFNERQSSFDAGDKAEVSAIGTKRTWRFALQMSAYDPKRTSSKLLLDYFINLREQRRWDGETERFRRFHVDRYFKICGLLHR